MFRKAFCLPLFFFLCAAASYADRPSQGWGELRYSEKIVNIRSGRALHAKIVDRLYPGELIRADFLESNWYAVFPVTESLRDEARALGYVYAPLLKPGAAFMKNLWALGRESPGQQNFLADKEYCNLKAGFNLSNLPRRLPQLSRVLEPHTGDLPEMLARKTIRVLTTYSMTNYFISKGRSYGFEYSLLKDYEDLLNRGRSRREIGVVIEFFPVPDNQLVPSLLLGLGDIVAAGCTILPEGISQADFTHPYLTDVHEVIVGHGDAEGIQSVWDLSGRQIYVRPISSHYKALARLNSELVARNLSPVKIIKANDILTTEDILELVNAGIIDFSVAESHLANLWSGVLGNLRIYDRIPINRPGGIAWMVRKNTPRLKASLNEFIKDHKKGTVRGNIYFKRYFQNARWIRNPLNSKDRTKFSRYAPLFKKYGAIYNIDWMLLAALAYQESGMDPTRRSSSGAIGLMQILPSTAGDKRIAIRNLYFPENNVHAGTKYLALIRDTYFADEKMHLDDRVRYALAAYNAGPTKIARCRELAAKMGFDANRWFHHGEVAALKLIGQETVRFVSNINKYYLAYSLSETLDCLKNQGKKAVKSLPSSG